MAGDTANTAARLQQAAEPGEILLAGVDLQARPRVGRGRALAPRSSSGASRSPVLAYRLLAVSAIAAEAAPRLEAPLVGRQDMLAQLEWALERTVAETELPARYRSSAPPASASPGSPTSSSTRLGERATVVRGRCLPYGEGITFWPLAEMSGRQAGSREGDGPDDAVAKLEALLEPDDEARTRRRDDRAS